MHLLAQSDTAGYAFLAGVLLIIMAVFWHGRRSRTRPASTAPIVRSTPLRERSRSHNAAAPDVVRQWEVDMHETARELSATLDSKMAALHHLIRAAEQESARLERNLAAARRLHAAE